MSEVLWSALAFVLTVMVLSYLVGDNPLFRLAVFVFIGVASGYAAVVVWYNVIWPTVILPVLSAESLERRLLAAIPLLLGVLLWLKLVPGLSKLGNISVAYLVGVGAAVAVAGAVVGTLFPQTSATIGMFDLAAARAQGIGAGERLFDAFTLLLGTVSSLAFFHFGTRKGQSRRPPGLEALARLGAVFIAVALGALFAGVYLSALTALVDRLHAIFQFLRIFLGG